MQYSRLEDMARYSVVNRNRNIHGLEICKSVPFFVMHDEVFLYMAGFAEVREIDRERRRGERTMVVEIY